jgi:hypothetical protein
MTNETSPPGSKRALLDAFDQVLKSQAEEREAERRAAQARRRGLPRFAPAAWVSVLLLLFTGAYIWVEQPPWIFPPPPPPESAAIKEASLRIALASAAQHVEHFRQRYRRLPRTLEEAGAHSDGLSYQVTGPESYQILGLNGPIQLSLSSADSLPRFIGNSFEVISRRSR